MIEKTYSFSTVDTKNIEKIIDDDPAMINHMILPKGEGLPEHFSNSNVYMIVIRGLLSIGLDEQEIHEYPKGTILNIPKGIKMNVKNLCDDILELFVIKAPAPGR